MPWMMDRGVSLSRIIVPSILIKISMSWRIPMVRIGLQIAGGRKNQRAYQKLGQGRIGAQGSGYNACLKRSWIANKK
jgi:hypothetical protein